ncbi:MAG: hypothetical protein OEV17_04920, partial [Nitrospira sp.]|nr:hypothetical protein [Nitrospira sp.]
MSGFEHEFLHVGLARHLVRSGVLRAISLSLVERLFPPPLIGHAYAPEEVAPVLGFHSGQPLKILGGERVSMPTASFH